MLQEEGETVDYIPERVVRFGGRASHTTHEIRVLKLTVSVGLKEPTEAFQVFKGDSGNAFLEAFKNIGRSQEA